MLLADARTTTFQDWVSVCRTVQGVERCHISQNLYLENEQGSNRLLQATVGKLDGGNVLQLILPLGVDLRPGIVFKIDEEEEFAAPYITCMQEGCVVAIGLDQTLWRTLRGGAVAKIGFRPFNTEQTVVLEMSLLGFTRASNTIK